GTTEPYRMFTSRAEYRLLLREDNADLRLTETGRRLGLIEDARWQRFAEKREAIEREQARLAGTWVRPQTQLADRLSPLLERPLAKDASLMDLLRRPGVSYEQLVAIVGGALQAPEVAQQVEIQAKYSGYVTRQHDEIERHRRHEETALPETLDYRDVSGLSREVQQKLADHRPATLGQAARISGVTPAAISLLLVHLKRRA
ncbi:MAG: tRNA uridine-5-carboxymethylaminomethyl(34) synthesis enzyme MnmG, partial [Acidiferrobacterales bacterium]|nr:tRNA uridine-5-carboxymethylaminomethyl(34) synthesis enzyme MnmG [Acidiferrobacterales bacterium]